MKIPKKALRNLDRGIARWKVWVLDPKKNHFFFFCDPHLKLIARPQDGQADFKDKRPPVCDYPTCTQRGVKEFFPNLHPRLAEGMKGTFLISKNRKTKYGPKSR